MWGPVWSDTELGDCVPSRAADGEIRCLPYGASVDRKLLDDTCSNAVMVAHRDIDTKWASEHEPGCPAREHVYALGEALAADTPTYERLDDGTCALQGTLGEAYFRVGPEVPAGRFSKLTLEIEKP